MRIRVRARARASANPNLGLGDLVHGLNVVAVLVLEVVRELGREVLREDGQVRMALRVDLRSGLGLG